MNPTWNQPTYSMQPQLQLEHELDLTMDSTHGDQSQPIRPQSLFANATYPPVQNFSYAFSNPNGASFSTGGQQQAQSRSFSYNNVQTNGVGANGRQTNSFLTASTDSGHQQAFVNHPTTRRDSFDPTFPPYVNSQSYTQAPYQQQFGSQDAGGSDLTATGLAENGLSSPPYVTSPDPMHESFPLGINHMQDLQPPQSYSHGRPGIDTSFRMIKRPREGNNNDLKEENQEGSVPPEPHAKGKGPGACARCKSLKVKCEFKADSDPCKRCMNGGHECVIPGRKKRRTPPKREHLLNQIRDQAAQITKLMAQLEVANRRQNASDPTSPSSNQHSPVLDPDDDASPHRPPKPEVEDWMAKARESIEAFGGFIGIGGVGMPKNLLVDGEFEDSESSGIDSDYEFAVQDSDGSLVEIDGNEGPQADRKNLRKTPSGDPMTKRSRSDRGSLSSPGGTMKKKSMALPSGAVPFGLMANLALKKKRGPSRGPGSDSDDDENNVGVASDGFFRPSPGPDEGRNAILNKVQQQIPHILTRGLITPKEAEKLFDIYFTNMNLSVSLLDPVLYTAQKTCLRSPFLFTVICAVASRHYSERPELYLQAMRYAQLAAGTALISGHKSVESVCGYILLSLYPVPARRWEDDRSWLYLGLAIRIATDLNLHHPNTVKPLNEMHAREMLNRTRVWLNCFNLDRSTGSQYGKPPIIKNTDYIATHSEEWWESSEYNLKHFDIHICAYNAELKIMAGFLAKIYSDPEHPTGLNKEADFELIATETDDKLVQVGEKWFARLAKTDMTDPQNCFRTGLLRLAYSYARLIALSFGFQHAFGKNENETDENPFLLRCLRAASDVVKAVVNDIGRPSQRIYLRHGPDAQSVFLTFASAFLVKLLQPKFASYLTVEQRVEIRALVQQVVDLLGSKEVAIDDRHGPKLYSRFLKGLLAAPMAKVEGQVPTGKANPLKRRAVNLGKTANAAPTTPDYDRPFEFPTSSMAFDLPSPASTTLSLSPQPNHAAISFDQFAPVSIGIDPFFAGRAPETHTNQSDHVMNMPDFFSPPLPFDNDILQSMQSLSEDWAEIPPGFHWMNMKADELFPDNYQMSKPA